MPDSGRWIWELDLGIYSLYCLLAYSYCHTHNIVDFCSDKEARLMCKRVGSSYQIASQFYVDCCGGRNKALLACDGVWHDSLTGKPS